MGRSFEHLDQSLELIETTSWGHKRYKHRKGPNGRNLCKQCGTEVPPNRQVYCSKDCAHNWNMMTSQSYARGFVFERDKGVCAACGLDTQGCPNHYQARALNKQGVDWRDMRKKWLVRHGYDQWHSTSLWEADHIVAVIDGGHTLGLSNLQTLCVSCHKKKTAELAARRAIERRIQNGTSRRRPVKQVTLDLEKAS